MIIVLPSKYMLQALLLFLVSVAKAKASTRSSLLSKLTSKSSWKRLVNSRTCFYSFVDMSSLGLDVIIQEQNSIVPPSCSHGPTVLFSRKINGTPKSYYACSACRDRKECKFYLWEEDLEKYNIEQTEVKIVAKTIKHRQLFSVLNEIKAISEQDRIYCHTCSKLDRKKFINKHAEHSITENVTEYQLDHPSELMTPLDNTKKEAQFLFSKQSVKIIADMLINLNYKNVICVGTPRIHEYILSNFGGKINSLLLDIDDRYHNFFGPLNFCWYNVFNHHFFSKEAREVFDEFIDSSKIEETIIITDPPFGGRIELLSHSFKQILEQYKNVHNSSKKLAMFWIFPYFMESHISNSLPNFKMLDYKVDYDNHPLFQRGPKGRKQGSPVRIFTNLNPSSIKLPEDEGYKFCKPCNRWIAPENKHCKKCRSCTSKDGRTYVHCNICERCVKPTWTHCQTCNKCAQTDHKCGELAFLKNCFHCKEAGHKKSDCPKVDHEDLQLKRKLGLKTKSNKKVKRV